MTTPVRFGSAVSLVALATILSGCAFPQSHSRTASSFGGQANGEIGLATRALAALTANDVPTAINFAERAVEKTPDDAGFRALLGNSYFAGGRFVSAEAAFKDSLAIYSNQPNVVLKLALVQIAQGKNGEAVALLDNARAILDPSDYGLALTLAGRPADAIAVLEPVARTQGADARVRQNLALAHAFSGDWASARAIAAQDVPANQLDQRIQQWMQLATPKRPSDQVAAFTGIAPAAADPGQPTRLALVKGETRQAVAAPVAQPQPEQVAQQVAQPITEPQAEQVAAALPPLEPAPVTVAPASVMAEAAVSVPESPAFVAIPPAPPPPRTAVPLRRASAPAVRPPLRNAMLSRRGNSTAVVQLGAYGSPERVAAAWNVAAHRFGVLKAYTPMSARFDSAKGPVYRLSVRGFASDRDARLACESLRNSGASCFVRNVAGDAPVQFASR